MNPNKIQMANESEQGRISHPTPMMMYIKTKETKTLERKSKIPPPLKPFQTKKKIIQSLSLQEQHKRNKRPFIFHYHSLKPQPQTTTTKEQHFGIPLPHPTSFWHSVSGASMSSGGPTTTSSNTSPRVAAGPTTTRRRVADNNNNIVDAEKQQQVTSMKWHWQFWDFGQLKKAACQNSGTVVDSIG